MARLAARLPATASRALYRLPEAEVPLLSRSVHQFGKSLFCLLSQLESHFVLLFIDPHFPPLELGLAQTISPLLSPISTKQ